MRLLLLWLLAAPPSYEERIAAEAAVVVVTRKTDAPTGCCEGKPKCVGGKIIHGDGHVTDCPCPDSCSCKKFKALLHPPTVIR